MQKKTIFARLILILFCLAVFCTCFWVMNQTYDPLARYPYATDENREVILQYLDSEDIDYIITNQIEPDEFLDFLGIEGFNIRYCRLYTIAKETQEESNAYIINFVNRYRSHFSASTLRTLLTHYSYVDLTTFYETQMGNQEQLSLVNDPSNPLLILNDHLTVYKYEPSGLSVADGISLQPKALEAFQQMNNAYISMLGQEKSLEIEKGYTAYDQIFTEYTQYSEQIPDGVNSLFLPAGQNEFQLGYTIAVSGYTDWINQCISHPEIFENHQYDLIEEGLDPGIQECIQWLEENAYRFGFVIRYPNGKEDVTGHVYNPFVLRYVGNTNAKSLHDRGLAMEELELSEELN